MFRTLATPLVASEYDLYLFVNSMGKLHFSELFDSLFDELLIFVSFAFVRINLCKSLSSLP